jgi:hypothetical protein
MCRAEEPVGRIISGRKATASARSPHERSDMREQQQKVPDIAPLIRATLAAA